MYLRIKAKVKSVFERCESGRKVISVVRFLRWQYSYLKWLLSGRCFPTCQWYKVKTIKSYAKQYDIKHFVETGTLFGDTTAFVAGLFDQSITIELDRDLCAKAQRRFQNNQRVQVHYGDSAEVLPKLVAGINHRILFWLDGHYSGGVTTGGKKQTPICEELRAIFAHPIKDHVILIDDARNFTGVNDYPTVDQVRSMMTDVGSYYDLHLKNDIVRIVPRGGNYIL